MIFFYKSDEKFFDLCGNQTMCQRVQSRGKMLVVIKSQSGPFFLSNNAICPSASGDFVPQALPLDATAGLPSPILPILDPQLAKLAYAHAGLRLT